MLGNTVIYRLTEKENRVGIVTRVYDTGVVDLAVFGNFDDHSHPLDQPVKKFGKMKEGVAVGEFLILRDVTLVEKETKRMNDAKVVVEVADDLPPASTMMSQKQWRDMNLQERKAYQAR